MIFGSLLILIGLAAGKDPLVVFLSVLLFLGFILVQLKLEGLKIGFLDGLLAQFDRNEHLPARGGLAYVAGALFLVSASQLYFALGVIAILAFGDGFATLIGISGKHKLPINKRKTWEGSLAFLIVSIASSMFFLGVQNAFIYSLIFAVVEAIDFKVDDNILIPFAGVLLSVIIK